MSSFLPGPPPPQVPRWCFQLSGPIRTPLCSALSAQPGCCPPEGATPPRPASCQLAPPAAPAVGSPRLLPLSPPDLSPTPTPPSPQAPVAFSRSPSPGLRRHRAALESEPIAPQTGFHSLRALEPSPSQPGLPLLCFWGHARSGGRCSSAPALPSLVLRSWPLRAGDIPGVTRVRLGLLPSSWRGTRVSPKAGITDLVSPGLI